MSVIGYDIIASAPNDVQGLYYVHIHCTQITKRDVSSKRKHSPSIDTATVTSADGDCRLRD